MNVRLKSFGTYFLTVSGWWFGTFCIFPYIGNVIIPTDDLIFFRGVGIPPPRHVGYCFCLKIHWHILSYSFYEFPIWTRGVSCRDARHVKRRCSPGASPQVTEWRPQLSSQVTEMLYRYQYIYIYIYYYIMLYYVILCYIMFYCISYCCHIYE